MRLVTGRPSQKPGAGAGVDTFTMAEFVDLLWRFVDRPVVDMTNLKGAYDFSLQFQLRGRRLGEEGDKQKESGHERGGTFSYPAITAEVGEKIREMMPALYRQRTRISRYSTG